MNSPMIIDVWSDVVCPFCYLGTRQLDQALEQFEHRDQVVLRRHAFELDPHAPATSDLTLNELLAKKYAMTSDQAAEANDRVSAQARSLGLEWHLERARPANTFLAHRLIALAATQGLDQAMSDRLFRAYFSEGEQLGDPATLERLAAEVGVEGAPELWTNDDFAEEVRGDERVAHELNITGVPSLVVDRAFMIVGAQGTDTMLEVLRRAWERRGA